MLDALFNVAGILSDGEMWRARLVSVALACWYVAGKQGEREPEPNARGDQGPWRSSSADLVLPVTKHFWREGVTSNNVKNRGSSVDIISQAFHYELCKAVEFCFTIYPHRPLSLAV